MALRKILVDVEMIDGTEYEDIRIIMADMIRHSETAQRHKWPDLEHDRLRAAGFMAFAAMQRLGMWPKDRGFEDWSNNVAAVGIDMGESVDPTAPATPAA